KVIGTARDRWPGKEVIVHLRDTRGTGVANMLAALELGVQIFDTAIGGWGGCPFAEHKGAAVNVATEDAVFLCQEIGVETGIDLNKIIEVSRMIQDILGRDLPGKVKSGGNLANYRARAVAAA